jgi:hypothetical protein
MAAPISIHGNAGVWDGSVPNILIPSAHSFNLNDFPLDSNLRFVMIYRGGKSFNDRAFRRSYEALEPMVF